MSGKWNRRLRRLIWIAASAVAALALLLTFLAVSGLGERWMRNAIVRQIEQMTGARAELGAFHFHLFGLNTELDDLTLHGREAEGMPPFVHVDHLRVALHIASFFGRKIELDNLEIEHPAVMVRIEEDGTSNVPAPKTQGRSRAWRERIFDLNIRHLKIMDGSMLFNDARIPLDVEGGNFHFTLDFDAPMPGRESYAGAVSWQRMELAARRYLPFRSDIAAKFTLTRESFSLDELRWKMPHSALELRAELASFRKPDWNFHYRGRVGLEDIRVILRKPHTPAGDVDFSGEARYSGGGWTASGHYSALRIAMPYAWFHTGGIESEGRFEAAGRRLVVPSFTARALGGTVEGRMEMEFQGLQFRVESRARGLDLAALLAAVDNPSFPMHTLHWGGAVDVDSVTTWTADFQHVCSTGESRWSPPARPAAGQIPASARIDFDYGMDRRAVTLKPSEVSTPSMHLTMEGFLGEDDSALEVQLDAGNLLDWDDFINLLRGREAEPRRIAGRATFVGRVLGPLNGPTFAGHVHTFDASYDRLNWDEIEGDLSYSPDELRLTNAHAKRGKSTATLDLRLGFDGAWSFLPESPWSLTVKFDRAPTDELQGLFGTAYPVRGILTGEFHGSGTRASPQLDGEISLAEVTAWGYALDSARGEIHLQQGEIAVHKAELRRNGASIAGDLIYRTGTQEVEFALAGRAIPLEKIETLQIAALPIAGRIDFDIRGKGPLLAPAGQGSLRLIGLRVGTETQGDFEGKLDSDGRRLRIDLNSEMTTGKLQGHIELGLAGDYPYNGEVTLDHVDLDPFIQTGLHLKALTGHSSVDGRFTISGALRQPNSLAIEADISRVALDYESVKLENDGPLRFTYRRDEIRIAEAHLRGPDTDFRFSGSARFSGTRQLNLNLDGSVNLRLLTGLFPGLEARGAAQIEMSVEGTYARPRIIGRAHVSDAAANYRDFPAGLSHVTGDFVFDRNRLLFEGVTGEAGGGTLTLSGSLNYGEGPVRYEISATAKRVRIRYPEGLSWLAGGTLRLSGTPHAAVLSGHITVDRLLMGPGVDLSTLIVASHEAPSGAATTAAYVRNLQFDIQVDSGPDARLEWTGANVQTEGNLRVRGTWEHPILLGNVHLLGGEMTFRGSRYTLSRGDINFANPFRFDPVLNVEATTRIQQYEITLDFTGPASHLSLAYRSDPPLPSSDIIALLALGTTGEESALRLGSTTAAQNYGATALLSEAISSQLGGRIERLFGISRFRVDPFLAGTSTEQNAAARVTVEQRVAHDLTITYSTNATSNQQQVIQVEYAVSRGVSIIALRDINGTFGVDVVFKKRLK